jgi:hypothetical protein
MRRMSSGDNGGRRGCRGRDIMRGVCRRRMLGRRLIEDNGIGWGDNVIIAFTVDIKCLMIAREDRIR